MGASDLQLLGQKRGRPGAGMGVEVGKGRSYGTELRTRGVRCQPQAGSVGIELSCRTPGWCWRMGC